MKKFVKILSVVLMLSVCFSALSAFTSANTPGGAYKSGGDESITDSITADNGGGERLAQAENDLNTFVWKNEDGTNTMEIFDHPVKYIDGDGATRDISLSLKKDLAGYVPAAHDIKTVFPEKLGDGIALSKDDVRVTLIPGDFKNTRTAVVSDDKKAVLYPLDAKTSYKYSLTYTGFKEDIVVEEYNGRTEYDFTLMTGGLALREEDGSYTLVDEHGKLRAIIGDIIVFTADERNNNLGTMTHQTVRENEEYRLTIHLDDEYLRDEKTVYPIRIDPTIEINYSNNGSGAILDMTVNSSTTTSGTSSSLYVGNRETFGSSRVLMRFPNLNLSGIACADNIVFATVSLRDLLCESESMKVSCYEFNNSSWNETTSYTWESIAVYNYGAFVSSKVVSYANGQSINHTYPFVITKAVKDWKNSGNSTQNSLLFMADMTLESSSTYTHKTFGSYNGTSLYRPSLKIIYAAGQNTSVFYSQYDSSRYNDAPNASSIDVTKTYSYAQYRMNCYGYAMGYILDGETAVRKKYLWDGNIYIEGYLQQPGEFASDSVKKYIKPNLVPNDPETTIENIIYNVRRDAQRWGYTISVKTIKPWEDVPQYGTNSRLIALVTGDDDFHFYRQEHNKMWSHKPGSNPVTNKSLSDDTTILTNDNIRTLANSGTYSGGSLRFLVVTKPAAVDFPHAHRCCNSFPCKTHSQTAIYKYDTAGDYIESAKTITDTIVNGKLDYKNDVDVFRRAATNNVTYSEVLLSTSSSSMILKVYDSSKRWIKTIYGNQTGVSLQMTGQQTYYFEVGSTSGDISSYILIFS